MANQALLIHPLNPFKRTILVFPQKNLLRRKKINNFKNLLNSKKPLKSVQVWRPFLHLQKMRIMKKDNLNQKMQKENTKNLKLITICWNKVKIWFKSTRSFRKKNQSWRMNLRPKSNTNQKTAKRLLFCKRQKTLSRKNHRKNPKNRTKSRLTIMSLKISTLKITANQKRMAIII